MPARALERGGPWAQLSNPAGRTAHRNVGVEGAAGRTREVPGLGGAGTLCHDVPVLTSASIIE